jgi:PAS domain S-box-containing protein
MPDAADTADRGGSRVSLPAAEPFWKEVTESMGRDHSVPHCLPRRCRGIQVRLAVCFSLAFAGILIVVEVLDFVGIPFTRYEGRLGQYRAEAKRNLQLIADLKEERLKWWFNERGKDLFLLSDDQRAEELLALLAYIRDLRSEGIEGDDLWQRVRETPEYRDIEHRLRDAVSACKEYQGGRFLDAATLETIVSTDGDKLGRLPGDAVYLREARFKGESLSHVDPGGPGGGPVLHLARQVCHPEGEPVALLVVEVDTDLALRPILHTGEALGDLGEAMLIGQDRTILTSLKHPLAEGSRAQPLKYQVQSEAAQLAACGRRGVIETTDYRGQPVLAAYRGVELGPGERWGLVVKRDLAELLAPVRRNIIDSTLLGIFGLAATVALAVFVSRSLTRPVRALSRTAQEVAGGNLDARAPVTTPDEVGSLAVTFNAMVERIANWQQELETEIRIHTSQLRKVNEALSREVAERTHVQEALETAHTDLKHVFNAAVPLAVIGRDRRVLRVNDTFCSFFGLSRDEVLGKRCSEVWDGPRCTDGTCPLEEVAGGAERVEYEHRRQLPDGREVTCAVTAVPYRSARGQLLGIVQSLADVSEYRRVQQELARHRDHLEELVAERTQELAETHKALVRQERLATLGQLTATVSHELRNPLGTIRTSLFLLAQRLRNRPHDVDRAMQRMERSIGRCNIIISDLLDFSRCPAPQPVPTDLGGYVAVVLNEIEQEAEIPSAIVLKRELAAGVQANVDRERFRRAMTNAIQNACQAMQPDGGTLTVGCDARGQQVRVWVRDTGCGIPQDRLDKVFEPLFSTKSFGVGLGLPIVRQVTEQHGGRVEIESLPGQGTTVTLWLPAHASSGGEHE